jgi:diacylglycerol kinase (ATP)
MRVALVHNVTAGDREYESEDLVGLLREAGHTVDEFGKRKRDVARAIATRPDLLAVAGGDGTVAKAAIALRDSTLPLFILPTGTANNIARSLGIAGSVPEIIGALASARPVRLDIGHVSAPWGEKAFVEAAGVGFMGTVLRRGQSTRGRVERFVRTVGRPMDKQLQGAARGVARFIRDSAPRYHEVRADGEDLSGDYLVVEAMNIREIGPRLTLAPHARPGDGLLDLVLVRPEDRAELADYFASLETSREFPPIVSRQVRQVEMSWRAGAGHIDDTPWPRDSGRADDGGDQQVRVGLQGAIRVLVPAAR